MQPLMTTNYSDYTALDYSLYLLLVYTLHSTVELLSAMQSAHSVEWNLSTSPYNSSVESTSLCLPCCRCHTRP